MDRFAISLADEQATMQFGEGLSLLLRAGDIICLTGPLGAGKSTLARALIKTLCNDKAPDDIPSPTFTLIESYDGQRCAVHHLDLYRLENPEDVFELGLEEAMETGICIIEWAERIADFLPPDSLVLSFTIPDDHATTRQLTLTANEPWIKRLNQANFSGNAP